MAISSVSSVCDTFAIVSIYFSTIAEKDMVKSLQMIDTHKHSQFLKICKSLKLIKNNVPVIELPLAHGT